MKLGQYSTPDYYGQARSRFLREEGFIFKKNMQSVSQFVLNWESIGKHYPQRLPLYRVMSCFLLHQNETVVYESVQGCLHAGFLAEPEHGTVLRF